MLTGVERNAVLLLIPLKLSYLDLCVSCLVKSCCKTMIICTFLHSFTKIKDGGKPSVSPICLRTVGSKLRKEAQHLWGLGMLLI